MSKKLRFLASLYRADGADVALPPMDIFLRLELRDLWWAGVFGLRNSLHEGHLAFLREKGKRYIDAFKEDWWPWYT